MDAAQRSFEDFLRTRPRFSERWLLKYPAGRHRSGDLCYGNQLIQQKWLGWEACWAYNRKQEEMDGLLKMQELIMADLNQKMSK